MEQNIEYQACLWLIEKKEGLSPIRQSEFNAWIKNDLHNGKYDELNHIEECISFIPENLKEKLRNEVNQELEQKRLYFNPFLMAASILLVTFISIFYVNSSSEVLYSKVFESDYKVQKNLVLPDNTIVSLDAKTKMQITYFKDKREVTLIKGNVMFDIGKDKKRPFIIYTKTNTIEDIGTSFEVSIKNDMTTVKVKEGRVRIGQIYNNNKDSRIIYILDKEESIKLNKYGKASDHKKVSIAKIANWEDNKIIFNDTPLNEVINEFLKYTPKKVEIDKRISNIKVTGNFNTNELENFINSLPQLYPIKIEKNDSFFYLKKGA